MFTIEEVGNSEGKKIHVNESIEKKENTNQSFEHGSGLFELVTTHKEKSKITADRHNISLKTKQPNNKSIAIIIKNNNNC